MEVSIYGILIDNVLRNCRLTIFTDADKFLEEVKRGSFLSRQWHYTRMILATYSSDIKLALLYSHLRRIKQ